MIKSTVLAVACAVALSGFVAAPAHAASDTGCKGSVHTAQPGGGTTATSITAKGTTCAIARSIARGWKGTGSSKDARGRTWEFGVGTFTSSGHPRPEFKRGKAVVRWVQR